MRDLAVPLLILGAFLLALAVVLAFRVRRPFLAAVPPREPETEPPHASADAVAATVPLPVLPVPHIGATEEFGAELRALRDMPAAPELVSDVERELEWGKAWHDFEHNLKAEVDRIFAPALAFAEVESFAELRELVGLQQALADEGQLYAWIAGDYATAVAV